MTVDRPTTLASKDTPKQAHTRGCYFRQEGLSEDLLDPYRNLAYTPTHNEQRVAFSAGYKGQPNPYETA
jgi:hypothetical protein